MIKDKILHFTILPLVILFLAASYFRFVVQADYLVSYEGDCDPYTQSCYVYCEDDECSDPFYYSIMEREATEIYAKCGSDITECDEAYECQPDVDVCSVYFCEETEEECDTLTELDTPNDLDI